MTDLAPYEAPTVEHFTYSDPTGGRLVAWAEGLAAAHRIGSALCRTSFAPKHFQGKPDEAAAAIMFGDEIGLTPTQALRSVHVISGTPGLYARTMVALVQSKGHEVWTEIDTPTKVAVCGRRRGSSVVERSEWTVDRARKAGYTTNKKYETDPQAMLYARAAADVCRKVAADALAGLAYTVEEIELSEPTPTTTVRRTTTTTASPTKAQRKPVEPAPEPDLEPALEEERADTAPEPRKPSEEQRGLMFKSFQLAGFTTDARTPEGRQARLDYIGNVIGRPVESSNDLTVSEMSQVIDALQADADAEPVEPGLFPEGGAE